MGTCKLTLLTQAGSRFEVLMLFLFGEFFLTNDIFVVLVNTNHVTRS